MYTTKDLTDQCKKYGFALTNKCTYSRCIGDGVLQQVYHGDHDHVWIGITSMFSDLPTIFWKSNIPFTTYLPEHLHSLDCQRIVRTSQKSEDISLLINGGLSVLNEISTQEKLVQFANHINAIQETSLHLYNNRFWGAYIQCNMMDELMHEVCHDYTDICEGFRRTKENCSLLKNHQYDEFIANYLAMNEKLSKLGDLWKALLLNDRDFLVRYAQGNLEKNMAQIREKNIPMVN